MKFEFKFEVQGENWIGLLCVVVTVCILIGVLYK